MTDRLILLDASRLSDQALERLLACEESLSVWLRGGRSADEEVDGTKLEALKVALDVGALGQEEYEAAVGRLVQRDPFEAEREKVALLQAAVDGGALPEGLFKDAVARLHLAAGLSPGDCVEVRDDTISDWKSGAVTRITAETGRLQVHVQLDTYATSHVWEYLRHPETSCTVEGKLQSELNEVKTERDHLEAQVAALLKGGAGGRDASTGVRELATKVPPSAGRYEMYGVVFTVRANVLMSIGKLVFGTRAGRPVRVTLYKCTESASSYSPSGNKWSAVSETIVVPAPTGEVCEVVVSEVLVLHPTEEATLLLHSPDDMGSIIYDRAESPLVQTDGCLQVLGADAAQRDMSTNSVNRGFAFCGKICYQVMDEPNGSTPPSAPPSMAPSDL